VVRGLLFYGDCFVGVREAAESHIEMGGMRRDRITENRPRFVPALLPMAPGKFAAGRRGVFEDDAQNRAKGPLGVQVRSRALSFFPFLASVSTTSLPSRKSTIVLIR
jgi:hypothetical protein